MKKYHDISLILTGWFDEELIVPPSGSSNYTLSLDTTTYALTLESVTLSKAMSVSLATTSYTLTFEGMTFGHSPVMSLGTTSYALSIGDVTLTYAPTGVIPPPPPVAETPAGRNIRAYQYIIKIDGKEFVTPSLQQAVDLLNKAKDLARRHAMDIARAATEKAPKAPKIKLPKITGNAPVKELVLEVRKEIEAIYESALRDAEIAMLIELGKRRDEDEDTFLLML